MYSPHQRDRILVAPLLPLMFLVRPEHRANKPTGMEHFSESACFHRFYDLLWTLREPDAVALLNHTELAALAEFT